MKFLKFMIAGAVAATMVACGGSDEKKSESTTSTEEEEKVEAAEITLTPMPNMAIEGDDANYFSFESEDGTPDIKLIGTPDEDGRRGTVRATVLIKVYPNGTPKEAMHGFRSTPSIPLYIFNADKEQIQRYCRLEMSKPDSEALQAIIKSGKPGEVLVTYKDEMYPSKYNELFSEAKYVQIQSANLYTEAEYNDKSTSSSSSYDDDDDSDDSSSSSSSSYAADDDDDDDDDDVASSSGSSEIDDLLDEYESFVDDYISYAKKAQNGDITAMADAASLLNKANSINSKLSKMKSKMTNSQAAKLAKIAAKMAKAAF